MLAILENCTDYTNQNIKLVPAIQVSATGKKRKSIGFWSPRQSRQYYSFIICKYQDSGVQMDKR